MREPVYMRFRDYSYAHYEAKSYKGDQWLVQCVDFPEAWSIEQDLDEAYYNCAKALESYVENMSYQRYNDYSEYTQRLWNKIKNVVDLHEYRRLKPFEFYRRANVIAVTDSNVVIESEGGSNVWTFKINEFKSKDLAIPEVGDYIGLYVYHYLYGDIEIARWEKKEKPRKLTQEELIQFLNDIQEGVYSEPKTQ